MLHTHKICNISWNAHNYLHSKPSCNERHTHTVPHATVTFHSKLKLFLESARTPVSIWKPSGCWASLLAPLSLTLSHTHTSPSRSYVPPSRNRKLIHYIPFPLQLQRSKNRNGISLPVTRQHGGQGERERKGMHPTARHATVAFGTIKKYVKSLRQDLFPTSRSNHFRCANLRSAFPSFFHSLLHSSYVSPLLETHCWGLSWWNYFLQLYTPAGRSTLPSWCHVSVWRDWEILSFATPPERRDRRQREPYWSTHRHKQPHCRRNGTAILPICGPSPHIRNCAATLESDSGFHVTLWLLLLVKTPNPDRNAPWSVQIGSESG